jgi:hypothetical protein
VAVASPMLVVAAVVAVVLLEGLAALAAVETALP